MNRLLFSLAWISSACVALGCGGNVIGGSNGGSGGSGGSTATAGSGGGTVTTTTTTTSVPAECAVATNEPAPYEVLFRFTVNSGVTLYLRSDCYTNYTITSCADGYSAPVNIHGDCTIDCSESMGCIECGACPESGLIVSQDAWQEDTWTGDTYAFSQNAAGCTCHTTSAAPAGKYRITVPVFNTAQDAMDNANGNLRSYDFQLPAPNGLVVIPVDMGLD